MKITAIKQQVKIKGRYSLYVDGKYAFSLSESALLAQSISVGQELDDAQLQDFKELSGFDKVYGLALRYVAMRPRSQWEIETYLRRKDLDETASAQIIEKLAKLSLIDDEAFAKAWVNHRRIVRQTSKRRLSMELKQKHIASDIIEKVLREEEVTDKDELRKLVDKKRTRYPDKTKLMQYLARQGFSYDDIKSALEYSSQLNQQNIAD